MAALFLLITLPVFYWSYSVYTEGHSIATAAFLLPPLASLAIGGLIDPRILWSIGPHRHGMPTSIRVVGAIVFALGLAGTAALLVWSPKL